MISRGAVILYGSETGTAQDLAEKLLRQSLHFPKLTSLRLYSCDGFKIDELPNESLVIFICSTTGQGDYPNNMSQFWRFIMRRGLSTNCLSNLNFVVCGLGDSSYQKYNFVGKKLFRRLNQLGATPLLPLALADDQHDLGVDGLLMSWLPKLWTFILDFYGIEAVISGRPITIELLDDHFKNDDNIFHKYQVSISSPSSTSDGYHSPNAYPQFSQRLILKCNDRATGNKHFQDTRLIIFEKPESMQYKPGDVLYVQCANSDESVSKFLEAIGLKSDSIIQLSQLSENYPLPCIPNPCDLAWLVKHYFDFNAIPRKSFFELLCLRSNHEMEKERLAEFSSPDGLDDLLSYCNRPRRTALEVLHDFPNTVKSLTVSDLFDLFSPIKPRAFSIASSPTAHPNEIHLLVAVVRYKTKLAMPRVGLCSNYLANLKKDGVVCAWIRTSTISFPGPKSSVIMVGPGTGVAPFRSFIQERNSQHFNNSGSTTLFFGCRYEQQDFYFRDEFRELEYQKRLKLITAFSRDTDGCYVQKRITEHGQWLWRELSENSDLYFYVAGSAKSMPDDVRDAMKSVVQQYGGRSEEEAEKFIARLEQLRRYQTETWS